MNVMLSCDSNPYYYDFWPYVKKVWKQRFGINPKLVYINKHTESTIFVDDVLHLKEQSGFPIYLQAQFARIYFSQHFEDEICLLSDIDMFPVSRKFFDKSMIVKKCNKNTFFHLNPEQREFGQLPICYYCGYGSTYKVLFEDLSWTEFLQYVVDMNWHVDKFNYKLPKHLEGNSLWFSDELFLYNQVVKHNINVIKNNELIGNRRRDREQIHFIDFMDLMTDKIVDIHLPRPPSEHEASIEKICYTLTL